MILKSFLIILFTIFSINAQSLEFNCFVDPDYQFEVFNEVEQSIASGTTYYEVVIIAKDFGENPTLPSWFDPGMEQLPVFFSDATFENFIYQPIVLKADEILNHAFIFPDPYVTNWPGDCEHVHKSSNMIDVIQQADDIYDFSDYDYDEDDIVYVHFTSIGPKSGGVIRHCIDYITNDIASSGNNIIVKVDKQSRGVNSNVYLAVFYHESGHNFFSFPDMNHIGLNAHDHYAIGGFDVMCGGGFQGVPSTYNPWFRDKRNWYTPVPISANTTISMNDFQINAESHLYIPSSLPQNSFDYQKFYIAYYTDDNQYFSTWPFADPAVGGVLIWHVKNNNIGWQYSDWRRMEIDIESAHGKFVWNELPLDVVNTGIEDPLTGRDSLEVRKIALNSQGHWEEIAGPYFGVDGGSASIFYTPDEAGDFTFYSNPNSNWYNKFSSESYAQNIVSGFSMKNLRTENNEIKADFFIDDFTIPQTMTLPKGRWYFYNDLIVAQDVTLTIEAGTELYFSDDASLIVNGTLKVQGLINNRITFDHIGSSNWYGIVFNSSSGSSSSITNSEIKNATYGLLINNSSPSITSTKINYCYFGILIMSGAAPKFYNNTITYNDYNGVHCIAGVTATFGTFPTWGDNVIRRNGNIGIYAAYSSTVFLGKYTLPPTGGRNSIYENYNPNGYQISIRYGSSSMAEKNWWGSDPPDPSIFNTSGPNDIDYDPWW